MFETLDQAEEAMLQLYAWRARLADGQHILELGCGWGSLSLWMAEKFPRAQITGVSNSRTQKEHIDAETRRRGLTNLHILTCDINALDLAPAQFDRVVSVEMFEHLKNYYAEHWLENMDRHRDEILPLFAQTYGPQHARKWWSYWRVFYMSCAELWGYRKGTEWLISHYLFRKP